VALRDCHYPFHPPAEAEPSPDLVAQLAQEVYANDVLQLLVTRTALFEFEARKDAAQIFNSLLRRQIGQRWPTVEYLSSKDDVVFATLKGCVGACITLGEQMERDAQLRQPRRRAQLGYDPARDVAARVALQDPALLRAVRRFLGLAVPPLTRHAQPVRLYRVHRADHLRHRLRRPGQLSCAQHRAKLAKVNVKLAHRRS
jgi:hypothetical protein